MIDYRQINIDDKHFFTNLIYNEGKEFQEFVNMGWSVDQITDQFNKKTDLSFGAFYNNSLVSFILGDLFNIEKISEYEILLLYVCKNYRKQAIGTKLFNKIKENNSCLQKIYIEVSTNNYAGISFYKKMNFKIIDKRKNYFFIQNERTDALIMNKTY